MVDISETIRAQLLACRDEVTTRPDHFLTFATRRRMLLTLGPPWTPEAGMTVGHQRRALLAVASAERVLPVWEGKHGRGWPHDLLERASEVAHGHGDRLGVFDEAGERLSSLDGGGRAAEDGFAAMYVGYAAVFAGFVAYNDELLEPDEGATQQDLDNPEDHHLFDSASWAAAAWAGDFPWGEKRWFNPARSMEFWTWYLDSAVPSVLLRRPGRSS